MSPPTEGTLLERTMHPASICLRAGRCLTILILMLVSFTPAHAQVADTAGKRLLAANGLYQRQLYKLAAQEYAEFLKQNPDHPEALTARYAMGVCHYRLGDFATAESVLQEVVKDEKYPQRPDALLVLGHSYLSAKDYDKAIATFDEILSKHPAANASDAAALNRAQAFHLMGKSKEAETALEVFLKDRPTSPRRAEALYFLGLARHAISKDVQAADALKELIDKYPPSKHATDAMLLRGQVLEAINQLPEAESQYRQLLQTARAAEGWYSLGLVQYKSTKYNDAEQSLKTLLAQYPSNPYAAPAKLQLALTQVAARKLDDARATLRSIITSDPSRTDRARYWLSQCDLLEKKYDSALFILNELAKAKPDNLDQILFDRAECLMGLGKFAEAAGEFSKAADQFPASPLRPQALYRRAFSLHKTGDAAASLAACEQVKANEGSPLAQSLLELKAENLFFLARYSQAADLFSSLAQSADADKRLRWQVRLGQCAYFVGDYAKAIEILSPLREDKSLAADPQLFRSILLLGDAMLQSGKNREGAQLLSDYAATAKDDREEALLKAGLGFLRAGDQKHGEEALVQAANGPANSPWALRALFEFGQVKYRQNDPSRASDALRKVISARPPADIAGPCAYFLAWIDFDAKRFDTAADGFAAMARLYPKDKLASDALFYRAVALKEAEHDDKALVAVRDYLKLGDNLPNTPKARQLEAACLLKLGRHVEAAQALSKIASDPKSSSDEILYDLAWSKQSAKDVKGAEETYRRLIADYPKSRMATSAKSELAELLLQNNKAREAADLLESVIADPASDAKTIGVAMYRLGSCYEKLGEPNKAAQIFSDFVEKHGNDELSGWARYQAGINLARQGKLAEARRQFDSALAGAKGELASATLLKLGEVTAQAGDYDESEKQYRRFIEEYPDNRLAYQAQFGIGWSLENRKKYDQARDWYGRVTAANSSPTAARAQFQIGETYYAQAKYDRAVTALLAVADVYAYPDR